MSESIINPSQINIYGINSFINKFADSDLDILDLESIKDNFKIDYEYDESLNEITKTNLPSFTQLTFNKRVKTDEIGYSTSYNRPPLGPISNYCYCSYCKKISPEYHTEDCEFPEKKSLLLTIQGVYYYVIQNTKDNFNESINNFKTAWLEKTLTQAMLNEFLLIPSSIKLSDITNDKIEQNIPLNYTFTKIPYLDVVKSRGPSKLAYTTATQKFSNHVMITYEYFKNDDTFQTDESNKTSIRIYKNGLINIINVPSSDDDKNLLYETLVKRINESEDAVNLDYFNQSASKFSNDEYDEYEIIEQISYIHSVNSQFNMWDEKTKYSIKFNELNDLISPLNSQGKIVNGEFTTVSNNNDKQIIELTYKSNSILIVNWEHSLGRDTRSNTVTREVIKCVILPENGIKISLQIHKHGTFQMSMSYCNVTDVINSICTNLVDKSKVLLNFKLFEIVKEIFAGILTEKPNLINLSLDYFEKSNDRTIRNTVSGNAPPSKPNTTTAVCRSSDPRKGHPGLRPIPYSFKGTCPETRQYLNPIGVKGKDGLYYPCCSAKTINSEKEFKNYLINGFPNSEFQEIMYGVNKIEDTNSGILIPGSINIGAQTKAKIDGVWTPIKILGQKGKSKKPKEFLAKNLNTDNIIEVKRELLERDTRYFPGLKTLNKENLIKCIMKNYTFKNNNSNLFELENLNKIKSLINNIPDTNFNPILSTYSLPIFESLNFYVTSVPINSNMYYLYINENDSYYINIYGNKIVKGLSESINEEIILLGYLENDSEKYFVTDILYFNRPILKHFAEKIKMLQEIEETFFLTENSIEFPNYKSNIIKSSKELLQQSSDIFLIFTPESNYLNFKIWSNITIEPEITLQLIDRDKTNNYILGYEDTSLNELTNIFNDINIPKQFINSNDIKLNDYILFKFDYNLQTNELSSRKLVPLEKTNKPNMSFNETLIKLSLILNPIKESFFMNNKYGNDFIWIVPGKNKMLKYVTDGSPLIAHL